MHVCVRERQRGRGREKERGREGKGERLLMHFHPVPWNELINQSLSKKMLYTDLPLNGLRISLSMLSFIFRFVHS